MLFTFWLRDRNVTGSNPKENMDFFTIEVIERNLELEKVIKKKILELQRVRKIKDANVVVRLRNLLNSSLVTSCEDKKIKLRD